MEKLKACKMWIEQPKMLISQFTFFRNCTSLKSLRLLGFLIFFDGHFGSRSEIEWLFGDFDF